MPVRLPFAGLDRRTAWIRAILLSASFLGLIASAPVWLNSRMFPILPITRGIPILPAPLDKLFFGSMLLALVLALWFYRSAVIYFLLATLFAFCEDQNRGQPWLYMYWVMFLLTLFSETVTLAACRWAISIAYIWSGIQKCNPRFYNIVVPWFLVPATRWHLPGAAITLLRWAISMAPFVEIAIGIGLWNTRLRRAAILSVIVLHVTALVLIGPLGYNYDRVVWPWNLAMIGLVLALFSKPAAAFGPTQTLADLRRCKPALAVVGLYVFLPILSFAGLWDSYFSFTLYAQSQATADIFVTKPFGDRLPPPMRVHVVKLRQAYDPKFEGAYVFDFQTWGFQQLHVPPIFEPRNYRSIFAYLRQWSREPDDLKMIIAPRAGPPIFYQGDGHWPLVAKGR